VSEASTGATRKGGVVKVGVTSWFCNNAEWEERIQLGEFDKPYPITDAEQYERELYLADLVEPLGFDSFWTIEHHFSPYGMTGNPTQLLTYMAGRTERIDLGSMVLVLPWHEPLRLAENISVLDNLLRGRRFNIGIGRGFAAREYNTMGIPYDTSRERMLEVLEVVRRALTEEHFSFEGDFFQIPRTGIRPRPRTADLTTQFSMAWASPDSLAMAANCGLAPLVTNLSGFEAARDSIAAFNEIRTERGWPKTKSIISCTVFCHEDQEYAEQYATPYWRKMSGQTIWHYDHLGRPDWQPDLPAEERDALIDGAFASQTAAGLFGTPEFVIGKIRELQEVGDIGHLITLHSFGDMPRDDVERSMRLFAKEVLPVIQEIPGEEPSAIPFSEWRSSVAASS
jgi:alkanesulfonate monooxygenase SsuD/methylene tetrahydromethanopterin reductase-like flavin-dependent oxidoreductase (luciferase family)